MKITTELSFTLKKEIGAEGQNSQVFLVHDTQLDAQLVVKTFDAAIFSDPDEYFAEARMLHDSQHPNVVDVKYACRKGDRIYIAMPFYPRGSLNTLLASRYLTVREVVSWGLDFLKGLHHIHTRGLVHFDLKPTNILLDHRGKAAVADFGLAKYVDVHGLAEQPRVYDSHLPPEFLTGSARGQESDIYQAGVTLYRMANGLLDFQRQLVAFGTPNELDNAIAAGEFPDRAAHLPHIPSRLRRLINKAMSVDPSARHTTALDLMNDLAKVDEHLDWQYSPPAGTGTRVWKRLDGDQVRTIVHEMDKGEFVVRCSSTNTDTGRARTNKKLSGRFQKQPDFRRGLTKAFREL